MWCPNRFWCFSVDFSSSLFLCVNEYSITTMTSRDVTLCAQRHASGWLMRTLKHLRDDNFGEVWLARNAGWLNGIGCERGGDDALAALAEVDAYDVDERDTERKAVWVRAKACVGVTIIPPDDDSIDLEALMILRQCADANDCFALCELGSLLLFRKEFQQYSGEGMKLLEKSAALGSVAAMNNIGTAYGNGLGVQKDQKKAFEWWQRAVDHGGFFPSTSLYYLYQRGSDGFDVSKVFHYCVVAADSGEPMALNNLGYCYEKGIGVAKNPEKAFSLYNQAYSLSGGAAVASNIGRCYVHGIGTKQKVKKGVELLNKAIEMGETNAMVILGPLLWSGQGIERDEQRGLELLNRAAELGNSDAKLYLSIIGNGLNDPVQAIQQNAVMPLFSQLLMIGFSYLVNDNMKNPELGFKYMQRTVQECESLIGSNKDKQLASGSLNQSVLSVYAMALYGLGYCYEEGNGVTKDEKEAVKCYERGVHLKYPFCALGLANCYENGIGVECNKEKAFELFKYASDLGDDNGMFHLGRCYEKGIGVGVDKAKALELYHHASRLGNQKAEERIKTLGQEVSFDKQETTPLGTLISDKRPRCQNGCLSQKKHMRESTTQLTPTHESCSAETTSLDPPFRAPAQGRPESICGQGNREKGPLASCLIQ